MEQLSLLRNATQRLITTPTEDLPRIAGFLASNIASCLVVLQGNITKATESSIPLHKLHTRISALLQDRTAAGRLTAAVVIKAIAEVSSPTDSSTWERWARGLIGCLNRPDPWEVKKVYFAAIVRLFLLARGSPSLQREVTNPLLPAFITASLASIRPVKRNHIERSVIVTSPLLPFVLRCWYELLQEHPVTFRPFVSRIKPICLSLVSDYATTNELRQLALQLLSSLHCCAPKASAASDWQLTITNIIGAAHDVLDLTLRGVHEEWKSNDLTQSRQAVRQLYSKEPQLTQSDVAGLGAWKGILDGGKRVSHLLQWASAMLRNRSTPVAIPLGQLLDLTARINAVTIPKGGKDGQYRVRPNPEVAQDEREALWASLASQHVDTLRLLLEVVSSFGQASGPVAVPIVEQVFDLFDAEGWHEDIRSHCYACLSSILRTDCALGLHLDRKCLESMSGACCRDLETLLPQQPEGKLSEASTNGTLHGSTILSATVQDQQSLSNVSMHSTVLLDCAQQLLPLLLEKLPSDSLSHASRTEIDRLSILVNHQQAMFASVMNPSRQKTDQRVLPSILPFFARAVGEADLTLEAIKRPRMPTISQNFPLTMDTLDQLTQGGDVMETEPLSRHYHGPLVQDEVESERPIEAVEVREKGISVNVKDSELIPDGHTLGKRHFSTVDDVQRGNVIGLDTKDTSTAERHKRTRLENDSDLKQTSDDIVEQISAATEPSVGEPTLFSQKVTEQPTIYATNQIASVQDDGDSDSDIPAINPELATDDDEDYDEEDQEGEDEVG